MTSTPGEKLRGAEKLSRISVKVQADSPAPRKPPWIRAKSPGTPEVARLKSILREQGLHTVCEEASCPNLGECFGHGTATFMILGDICTRRCPFCDVAHGKPLAPDAQEPEKLAQTVQALGLRYVVITSVDRDDLLDGGGAHFADCIRAVRRSSPQTRIEILTPDFRRREDKALAQLDSALPDVFNHNLETVPRLYKSTRPGADYEGSLHLLQRFAERHPEIPTKSGLMLGLGENLEEIWRVMMDLRTHGCRMLTLGQYLQPSKHHLPVRNFVHPDEFEALRKAGLQMGFEHVASGPMVRSSYHADQQAAGLTP